MPLYNYIFASQFPLWKLYHSISSARWQKKIYLKYILVFHYYWAIYCFQERSGFTYKLTLRLGLHQRRLFQIRKCFWIHQFWFYCKIKRSQAEKYSVSRENRQFTRQNSPDQKFSNSKFLLLLDLKSRRHGQTGKFIEKLPKN